MLEITNTYLKKTQFFKNQPLMQGGNQLKDLEDVNLIF